MQAIVAADHPRIRGEHFQIEDIIWPITGSSPHTRGARVEHRAGLRRRRIIPAYAGSTLRSDVAVISLADHPRIRGEHPENPRYRDDVDGSSPHTRGARRRRARRRAAPTDHPRIRGEHRMLSPGGVFSAGSSPHTRGAPSISLPPGSPGRIIPAYAGSTGRRRRPARKRPDHPRIRGEHPRKAIVCPSKEGSSPHTRGALDAVDARGVHAWIIPAYAGSTLRRPRGRGGAGGSSPHTRGARSWRI